MLFSGTVGSNIKFAGDRSPTRTWRRRRRSPRLRIHLREPDGYQAAIAQEGTNVSGGQRQRLAIARAIAKHPKIYLFDDSFSALDYKTRT